MQAPSSCWPNTTEEVREVAGRCAYMTEVMLERLRAESESDQLRSAFSGIWFSSHLARLDRPYDPGEETNDNEARTKHNTLQIHIQ